METTSSATAATTITVNSSRNDLTNQPHLYAITSAAAAVLIVSLLQIVQ